MGNVASNHRPDDPGAAWIIVPGSPLQVISHKDWSAALLQGESLASA
jgi:hypothetical protein